MVALFGYMPGWQGYVLARQVEAVPGRGGTCPVREVRARQRGCFLPGKRDLQDLTDLSDLSDIQDRLTPCQVIQHNTLSNQRRSSNLSKIIGQNEESNSLAFQILHIKVQSTQPEPPSARHHLPQVPQSHHRVAKRSSDRSSARRPCPQVLQWHPRVAKRASIGTSAWQPSTEALLGQGRVSKERESVPLT